MVFFDVQGMWSSLLEGSVWDNHLDFGSRTLGYPDCTPSTSYL